MAGASGDEVKALAKFRDKYKLNFTLLSDTGHQMLQAYGVWQEKSLYGRKSMGIVRTTFVIDGNGRITHIFPKVKVEGHVEQVLEALKG